MNEILTKALESQPAIIILLVVIAIVLAREYKSKDKKYEELLERRAEDQAKYTSSVNQLSHSVKQALDILKGG